MRLWYLNVDVHRTIDHRMQSCSWDLRLDKSDTSGVQNWAISPETQGQGYPWGQPCHSGVGGGSEALESDRPAFKFKLHRLSAR